MKRYLTCHCPWVTGATCHKPVDVLKHDTYLMGVMDDRLTLDARGLLCPLPVLKARKRLMALEVGECLTMHADDPAAIVDVPHFCTEAGHELVSISDSQPAQVFVIRKGKRA